MRCVPIESAGSGMTHSITGSMQFYGGCSGASGRLPPPIGPRLPLSPLHTRWMTPKPYNSYNIQRLDAVLESCSARN